MLILALSGFWVPAQANQQPSLELVGELVLSSTDEKDKKTIKLDVILVEEDDLGKFAPKSPVLILNRPFKSMNSI